MNPIDALDDRGVSPVIGVILMVAITVVLAAVIASFVLGLGTTSDPGPSVAFDTEYNGDNVSVTVQSGDRVDVSRLSVAGSGLGDAITSDDDNVTLGNDVTSLVDLSEYSEGDQLGAGDRFAVNVTGEAFEVDIVWTSEDGGDSQVLGGTEGPDA